MIKKAIWFFLFLILANSAWAGSVHAYSLFSGSSTPILNGTDAQAVELGVRFSSDTAGYIHAIKFYKGSTNTGTHIGNLWTEGGTNLASTTFANESASGWQQQFFSSPFFIATSTLYVASYHTNTGNYSYDANYFTNGLDNAPLHATSTSNGRYLYSGSTAFPTNTYNSLNYWVDVVFATTTTDTVPPTVSITSPANNTTTAAPSVIIKTATFDDFVVAGVQLNVDGINVGTEATSSPYNISWNTTGVATGTHTLLAVARDGAGNRATSTPVTVNIVVGPAEGPGGPILIITSRTNPFSTYYKEILLNEGYNMYRMMDISLVTASELTNYDVVILGEFSLSSGQSTMITDWVTNGGNLIAMRPDSSLASTLGITSQGTQLSEAYFRVNTASAPGAGITTSSLQFHGTADRYTLNGATEIATLYSNYSTSLSIPAVTTRNVGSSGGRGAAFMFDLARSIAYIRQGNPAWSGQHRTGNTVARTVDLFYGNASFDSQANWVDFTNIQIPQADEAQRLLANMIMDGLSTKKPLPHFWYLPRSEKAAIIMTGDDHGAGGTAGRFQTYQASSTPGCLVADWKCIRATSYIYSSTPITDASSSAFVADGFEIASHVQTNCADWTPTMLDGFFATDLAAFATAFPSVPSPKTIRVHCGAWSDYDSEPTSELARGIRFDTDYYYWPDTWILDRPGLYTGSGMPMRFTDRIGSTTDVYQANTQMTDESGMSYPLHVNTLLDNALGSKGYYGMFTVNAHTDYNTPGSNAMITSQEVIKSAIAHNVPVISAKQALDWLDGRNSSTFNSISWVASSSTLSFTITQDSRARGLTTLIPYLFDNKLVNTITRNGTSSISFATTTVKGITYAQFASDVGSYMATYSPDTTAPTVSITAPTNNATVSGTTTVSANASDNMAVAGVQFKLDGTNLGSEDTTAPYQISWGTLNSATGTHTLLAVARDTTGNQATSSSITVTVERLASLYSLFSSTSTPGIIDSTDAQANELGVRFSSDTSGYINSIRFYKASTNTGTHIGNLWTEGGTNLGSTTFSGETSSGWQEQSFANPIFINANTVYVASYHTNTGNYSYDANYFTNGFNNASLHATSTTNGRYIYTASTAFPTNTYNSANYWVDVVFQDASFGLDTTAPTVSITSPLNNTTVSGTTTISANATDSLVVAGVQFKLDGSNLGSEDTVAPYEVSWGTLGSATGTHTLFAVARDTTGNQATSSLITVDVQRLYSLFSATSTPGMLETTDSQANELGVRFSADTAGYIKAIRFYKGSTNTGTHIGNLWTEGGTNLASTTFSSETSSGWQEQSFASPVLIATSTLYVASYHTNTGNYSFDANYFNNGLDRAPLYATSTTNGVYLYTANTAFPNQTYNSSNYWVDVVFTPAQ